LVDYVIVYLKGIAVICTNSHPKIGKSFINLILTSTLLRRITRFQFAEVEGRLCVCQEHFHLRIELGGRGSIF
jgi:hypothetical protein